jgi:DivIVA domain-containing protein
MTTDQQPASDRGEPRMTPEWVRDLRFTSAGMLHPGYDAAEVDRFRAGVEAELARSAAERDQLEGRVHDLSVQVRSLEQQVADTPTPERPSDQAVRILAVAQQTADQYVAEAEDFSRQLTADARAQHDEQLRKAREGAGAIIQAAHEAAARMVAVGGEPTAAAGDQPSPEELREEVAYLKAFGQAVRVQLRSYLEALISDVESQWGKASPEAVAHDLVRAAAQRADGGGSSLGPLNVVAEVPPPDADGPGATGAGGVEVSRAHG